MNKQNSKPKMIRHYIPPLAVINRIKELCEDNGIDVDWRGVDNFRTLSAALQEAGMDQIEVYESIIQVATGASVSGD